jgi:hypothetical protein
LKLTVPSKESESAEFLATLSLVNHVLRFRQTDFCFFPPSLTIVQELRGTSPFMSHIQASQKMEDGKPDTSRKCLFLPKGSPS